MNAGTAVMDGGFRYIGRRFLEGAVSVGRLALLVQQTAYWIFRARIDWSIVSAQVLEMGIRSLPVIGLVAFFTGMVLSLQEGIASRNWFGQPIFTGMIVGFSLVKELGPVLTTVVFSGRVGAAIAAEIGTMKVTEQLDALHTLGTNPVRYLAVPRVIAGLIAVPTLVVLADLIGVVGGAVVAVYALGIPAPVFRDEILNSMYLDDFLHGFIKSFFFTGIVVLVSLYKGFTCEGGAEGVGRATTSAVVTSMVGILISDYFLSTALIVVNIGAGRSG